MSNLLVIFTVVFVLTIAAACGVGALVMRGGVDPSEELRRRKRKMRAAGTHRVFKSLP